MRRFLFSVVLIIGSFVLQTTLFQALSFGGIVPNPDDCTDGILWIYEREESGTSDRIFQWSAM